MGPPPKPVLKSSKQLVGQITPKSSPAKSDKGGPASSRERSSSVDSVQPTQEVVQSSPASQVIAKFGKDGSTMLVLPGHPPMTLSQILEKFPTTNGGKCANFALTSAAIRANFQLHQAQMDVFEASVRKHVLSPANLAKLDPEIRAIFESDFEDIITNLDERLAKRDKKGRAKQNMLKFIGFFTRGAVFVNCVFSVIVQDRACEDIGYIMRRLLGQVPNIANALSARDALKWLVSAMNANVVRRSNIHGQGGSSEAYEVRAPTPDDIFKTKDRIKTWE